MHVVDRERVVVVDKGLIVRIAERSMNPFTIPVGQVEVKVYCRASSWKNENRILVLI